MHDGVTVMRTAPYGFVVFGFALLTGVGLLGGCGASDEAKVSLRSVEPSEGSARGGETLVVRGAGFDGTTTVVFGSVPAASVRWVSSEELEVVTPLHLAGGVDVTAKAGEGSATLGQGFSFLPMELAFREAPAWYLPTIDQSLADALAEDFDGDGHPDLLLSVPNRPALFLPNSGTGSFVGAAGQPPELDAGVDVAVSDAGGSDEGSSEDGSESDGSESDGSSAEASLDAGPPDTGAPDAGLTGAGSTWVRDTARMFATDIDGDGDLDVVLCNRGGQSHALMRNEGAGDFSAMEDAFPDSADECRDGVMADVDGDGLEDLVVLGAGKAGGGKSFLRVYLQQAKSGSAAFVLATGLEEDDNETEETCATVSGSSAEVSVSSKISRTTAAQGKASCQVDFDTAGVDASVTVWLAAPKMPVLPDAVVVDLRSKAGSHAATVRVRDAHGEVFRFDAGSMDASGWKHVRASKLETWSSEGEGDGVLDLPLDAVGVAVKPSSGTTAGAFLMDALALEVPDIGLVHLDDFERKTFTHSWAERRNSVSAGDLDGDSLPDLLIGSNAEGDHSPLVLLRNGADAEGPVAFRPVASGTLDAVPAPVAATLLLDVDEDGDLDVLAGVVGGQDRYLSNDGKGYLFDDTLAMMPVDRVDASGLSAVDLDLDGRKDILIANDNAVNRIYVSRGEAGFRDATPAIPLVVGRTRRMIALDAEGDGDMDVFALGIGNDPSRLFVSVKESR
jgi:hypothetical protein